MIYEYFTYVFIRDVTVLLKYSGCGMYVIYRAASRAGESSSSSSSGESSESELESDEEVETFTREDLRRIRADNRIRFATLSQNERAKHVFYCQHHTDPVNII